MKSVIKYLDEVTGTTFDSAKKAIASERRHRNINNDFAWVDDAEALTKGEGDGSCSFANGDWCVQRSERFYKKLTNTIIEAVYLYEPWVWNEYRQHGGLLPQFVSGFSMLGRYLESGPLSKHLWLQMTVCRKCYRQYGQPYHALHCHCDGTTGDTGRVNKVETRVIKA